MTSELESKTVSQSVSLAQINTATQTRRPNSCESACTSDGLLLASRAILWGPIRVLRRMVCATAFVSFL